MIRKEGALPCTLTITVPVETVNGWGRVSLREEIELDIAIEPAPNGRVVVLVSEPYFGRERRHA